jgi:acyl phosphate:glycerol-3-phosphate acyltransferase
MVAPPSAIRPPAFIYLSAVESLPLLELVAFAAIGYLSGSLPMGVIVARLSGAPDPRTVGSGRTGGTNALRAMGFRRAALVAALDVAKGFVPTAAAGLITGDALVVAVTGIAATVGAWRSVFLRFHGGRGVATGIGAALFVQPLAVLVGLPFFIAPIVITRYVSLGSLVATAAGAVIVALFVAAGWNEWPAVLFAASGAAVVWLAHHDNIGRLLRGEERRFDPFARGGK